MIIDNKFSNMGPAGTPNTLVLSVQGCSSMIAVKIDGSAVTHPVSLASVPSHAVTNAGTFATQSTQSGTWNVGTLTTITNAVAVTDNGGSLTVDAPVGTPVFVRLSDGSSAISTLPVSIASVPLPTGAATESTLSTLNGKVTVCNTGAVTLVDASARPGWSFSNLTGSATTTVKSGAGVLHSIVINRSALSGTITIYDNTAGSGTKIGTITYGVLTLLTDPPINAVYDVSFATGLTLVLSGTNLDITVSYR